MDLLPVHPSLGKAVQKQGFATLSDGKNEGRFEVKRFFEKYPLNRQGETSTEPPNKRRLGSLRGNQRFVREHQDALRGIITLLVNDQTEAELLVRNVFSQFFSRPRKEHEKTSYQDLLSLAIEACKQSNEELCHRSVYFKNNKRLPVNDTRSVAYHSFQISGKEKVFSDAVYRDFGDALLGLEFVVRTVLVLHDIFGLAPAVVAQVIGSDIDRVSAHLHRARILYLKELGAAFPVEEQTSDDALGCFASQNMLSQYLTGDLIEFYKDGLIIHLSGCESCRVLLFQMSVAVRALREMPRQAYEGDLSTEIRHFTKRHLGLSSIYRALFQPLRLKLPLLLVLMVALATFSSREHHLRSIVSLVLPKALQNDRYKLKSAIETLIWNDAIAQKIAIYFTPDWVAPIKPAKRFTKKKKRTKRRRVRKVEFEAATLRQPGVKTGRRNAKEQARPDRLVKEMKTPRKRSQQVTEPLKSRRRVLEVTKVRAVKKPMVKKDRFEDLENSFKEPVRFNNNLDLIE